MVNNLENLISDKSAVVGVIGLGYVGLPLAFSIAESGFKVVGLDIDKPKIEMIIAGKIYLKHLDVERLKKVKEKYMFEVSLDFSKSNLMDVIILSVPTPLKENNEPDLSFIINTVESILPHLRNDQLICLESTTYPGTTEEVIKPRIESSGLKVGKDIFLVYSPEREDPGNEKYDTKTIPKVIGGTTENCLRLGIDLYSRVVEKVVPVSSTKTAEMTKLLENIYRAVNIGLVNEMKIVADKMGIDIWEVVEAASTKPFGFTPFYPGPGWGGHCIPIDPLYLTWKARQEGVNTRFIELAAEVNANMPEWIIEKISRKLASLGKNLQNANVLVAGISYKKNIDDPRESPAVKIMEILKEKKANLYYSDPYFPTFPKMREHHFKMKSSEINKELLSKMDCVIITTDHDIFDYNMIRKESSLVADTRGRYRKKTYANVIHC